MSHNQIFHKSFALSSQIATAGSDDFSCRFFIGIIDIDDSSRLFLPKIKAFIIHMNFLIYFGAGAKIDQKIHMDNESLDFWQEKPAGIIYINYTNEESARKIIASGRRDLTAQGEGFMKNLVVGHPKK